MGAIKITNACAHNHPITSTCPKAKENTISWSIRGELVSWKVTTTGELLLPTPPIPAK